MASQSELLEAKGQVQYFEIEARSILNRTKPNMPFRGPSIPTAGCEFGCQYCYARYTHEFMGMEDGREFEEKIYAKAAAPEILRRELRRKAKRDAIAIGTATDPYQPAERRFGRTRAILEVFADENGRSLSITTKRDLVARDIPLLVEIGRRNGLSVNITVTTLDADLARLFEPRAPRPDLRLATVGDLAEAGIPVGVFPNPIMPWITDTARAWSAWRGRHGRRGRSTSAAGRYSSCPARRRSFSPSSSSASRNSPRATGGCTSIVRTCGALIRRRSRGG